MGYIRSGKGNPCLGNDKELAMWGSGRRQGKPYYEDPKIGISLMSSYPFLFHVSLASSSSKHA